MTIADPESDGELHATRHYCLRRLGLIDAKVRRGGRQYSDFTAAIERLACVRYQCDRFYDPIRAEHRRVGFGFFSYSPPLAAGDTPLSSRFGFGESTLLAIECENKSRAQATMAGCIGA